MHNGTLEPSKVAAAVTDHSLPAPLFPGHGGGQPSRISLKIVEIE